METSNRSLNLFLLSCVFLFVCTEVLISPFYPQFFKKVYGINDPDLTGFYIMTCRLVVVVFTPIWGLIAHKRNNSSTLLIIGQWGTGISCFLMASSPSFEMFVAASVLLLIFKSSYFLLYTILISENRNSTTGTAASYHAVLQGAIVTATILSGWVIEMDHPLLIFWIVGIIECLMAFFSVHFLRKVSKNKIVDPELEQINHRSLVTQFLFFGIIVLTLHLAVNMIRPFFTTYTENVYSTHTIMSSSLYLIPSLMAIVTLPLIRKYSERLGFYGYVGGASMIIVGLFLQGIETSIAGLILFRFMFGIGAAWCLARIDVFIFKWSGNMHGDYSKISAIQNVGLLLAPVAASSIVNTRSISDVFTYASLFVVLHLFIFLWGTYSRERNKGKLHIHKEEEDALYK
ncbi:MFS transporter [Fictibacillus norfolkensis]|uniref:MFS transporter n=1 Tax=Fictibacillus norfolkensis TaxID=2762233 RepID=A0ABR8SJP5_9BACL|nr:MFS transporter [Fictibacillus norfolkensis]MBD7963712.1 MFS transporter [Fictibacillus norfolkensis]